MRQHASLVRPLPAFPVRLPVDDLDLERRILESRQRVCAQLRCEEHLARKDPDTTGVD